MKRHLCADSTPAPLVLAMALASVIAAPWTPARADDRPSLHTNQSYIEEVTRAPAVPIDDARAIFGLVLQSLPARVRVYPTENYYYFSFHHHGLRYSGNIRLAARDRDQGKVHFAFYEDPAGTAGQAAPLRYAVFDQSAGVRVERIERLAYGVSLGAATVIFELNDLSGAAPPAGALLPDEQYLGPIFDESAIRFFLVFNRRLKLFHYLLDESALVPEAFVALTATDRIVIGKRTGFAFYRDHRHDRKILIGVREADVRANNYFDGPFDQLPDNFLAGNELRDAMVASEPRLAGKIDRFGYLDDGNRHLIAPYARYRHADDLEGFHRCATGQLDRPGYPACFDLGAAIATPEPGESAPPKPAPPE